MKKVGVFAKVSNKLVSKRVRFHSLTLKKGMFFRPRDHSESGGGGGGSEIPDAHVHVPE